ncbi:hypothetical protein HDE_04119 [Halotydeus destructor]|nr:hypothetical protein HDE_04119 [Halotydeus destructor]
MIYSLVVFLVTVGCLSKVTNGQGFRQLVPAQLQPCCGDSFNPACLEIDSISRGQEGYHYIFAKDYVIKSRLGHKGYPEIEGSEAYINNTLWFGHGPDVANSKTIAAVMVTDTSGKQTIQVKKGPYYYKFNTPVENHSSTQGTRSADCKTVHPAFCDDSAGRLVDITVSGIRGAKNQDEVKAYYKQEAGGLTHIVEKNYIGTSMKAGKSKTPFVPAVSSITTFYEELRIHDQLMRDHGYVFEENGFACRYKLYSGQEGFIDYKGLRNPAVNCMPTQVFYGCPQSWCWSPQIDDLTVAYVPTASGQSSRKLVTFRGNYHFVSSLDVPAPVPKTEEMALSHPSRGYNLQRHAFSDAVFEISFGVSQQYLVFIKDTDITIYDEQVGGGSTQKIFDVFPNIWDNLVGHDNYNTIDAGMVLESKQQVVLFIGSTYAIYRYEGRREEVGSSIRFYYVQRGLIADAFPGLPANVDGATVIYSRVYIFKNSFVYVGEEEDVLLGIHKWTPEFAYYDESTKRGFWKTDKLCSRTRDQWASIRRDVKKPMPALKPQVSGLPTAGNDFIGLWSAAILVGLLMIPCCFTCFSREQRHDYVMHSLKEHMDRRHGAIHRTIAKSKSMVQSVRKGIRNRVNFVTGKNRTAQGDGRAVEEPQAPAPVIPERAPLTRTESAPGMLETPPAQPEATPAAAAQPEAAPTPPAAEPDLRTPME